MDFENSNFVSAHRALKKQDTEHRKLIKKLQKELKNKEIISLEHFKSVFDWIESERVATKLNDKELQEEYKLYLKGK